MIFVFSEALIRLVSIKDRKNFIKNFEKLEYMCGFFAFLWEYRSIRTQSPPLFGEGDS